ncbi:MAG: TRAP transporter substrate-binding protein DctP [Pseudomonadota bacterium]
MCEKKSKLFLILAFSLVLIFGVASQGMAAAKYTINCVSAWPKSSFETSNLLTFIDMVQKEADQKYPGQLKIVFKGGPEVVATLEQVEACRSGLVDLVLTATSYSLSVMPEMDTMSLTELRPWEEKAAGLYDYLEELHNKKANAHYLGRPGTGILFQLFLAKPIKTVDDLKGMKIRVSPTNVPLAKALGATPVQMPPPDIYTALERGVVDGYILPAHTIRDFGLIKPSKYIVFPGNYEACHSLLINLDVWKKLPKNLQDIISQQADNMTRFAFEKILKRYDDELASFKKEGMTFIELPPAEAAKFKKIARDALFGVIQKKAPVESEKILGYITKK